MKYRLIFIVFSLIFWVGCWEEDPLTATEGLEFKYTVPQGNHDYDARIVDWYEKDGFYILYKFDPKDIYFNVSFWTGVVVNDSTQILSSVAEEEYIAQQLQLMEEVFLNFYSDTVLQNWLPMKILLCSKLEQNRGRIDMCIGLDNIAVNYGSQEIEGLLADPAKKLKFKNDLHAMFTNWTIDKRKLVVPEEFATVSTYGLRVGDNAKKYADGFIAGTGWQTKILANDFKEYIAVFYSSSYEELTAEPEDGDYVSVKGILHPKKDVNGLIRKKYDVLANYFKDTLHMDLQAVGNYLK